MKNRIRNLRTDRQLTQKALGAVIGVNPATVSLYESGHRQPSQEILVTIAKFFDVSVDYLLGLSDARGPGSLILRDAGIGADLPEEAKKQLEVYAEFLKEKYKKD